MRTRLRALAHSTRGLATIEFALVAPVFFLLVLGGLELAHTMYVRTVLVGQLQKAARDYTLEDASTSARQAAIIASVRSAVQTIAPNATVTIVARSYHDYKNAKDPAEEFNDANHDGLCDNGEAFVDSNNNGHWDQDGSVTGRGGAKDVVLLEATASYDKLPFGDFISSDPERVLTARTLIRNQPNAQQAEPPTGTCK